MWTYDQLVQFVTQIVGNFQSHQWLIGVAVLFGGLTGIWRGDVNLPAPIGPWIRAEQAKRFSASFQYITIALVSITAIVSTMASGIPLKQAVLAAITAALTGLFGHDAIKAAVKSGLKATPPTAMVALVLGCVLVPATSGCAWLKSVVGSGCSATTTATYTALQDQTINAEKAIQGVQDIVAQLQGVDPAALASINAQLAKADAVCHAAEVAEAMAQQQCASVNWLTLLGDLETIWGILEPLVMTAVGKERSTVPLPTAVAHMRLARAKAAH